MNMAEDFADHREHLRQRKNAREFKFNCAFGAIRTEAILLGWTLYKSPDGSWDFATKDGVHEIRWWPSSGKTLTGGYFGTWPDLKKHLAQIAKEQA